MNQLYDILGLDEDAATADIRAAYRAKAKRAHPDAGGSAEAFAAIKLAHDVLTDPKRRERYDETGEFDPSAPDLELAAALTAIAQAFDAAVQNALQSGHKVTQVDLIMPILQLLEVKAAEVRGQAASIMQFKLVVQSLRGRFLKDGVEKGGDNLFEAILHAREDGFDRQLEILGQQERDLARALDLVEDYEFSFDTADAGFFFHVVAGSAVP